MVTYKTKNGKNVIIRKPVEDDAADIINYAKNVFASTDQLLTTLLEYAITVEDEKVWINKSNQSATGLILVAECDKKIIGLLTFELEKKMKNAHTGEFGVTVAPDFQRLGIGRALIQTLLTWASENKKIEKIFLNVFHTNESAIRLYQDLGFKEEGRFINAIKQPTGEYVDIVQMYIQITR